MIQPPVTSFDKSHKKEVLRFYKSVGVNAGYKGFDYVYGKRDSQDNIIACVFVSTLTESNNIALLHGLAVDNHYRHQQIASALINHVVVKHSPIVCFANLSLASLYEKHQMFMLSSRDIESQLTDIIKSRYTSYLKCQPELKVFASL